MWDAGISIYVVDYLAGGTPDSGVLSQWSAENTLRHCARDDEYYFRVVDNSDFQTVLNRIANRLKWARLAE